MLKQYTGFDHENVLKPGTPIRVTESGSSQYALVVSSNSVKIKVVRSSHDGGVAFKEIFIDEVQSGKYKIEPLAFEEVK